MNGAGKTSTFKMLTGDASISSGDAFVQVLFYYTKLNVSKVTLVFLLSILLFSLKRVTV